MTPLRAAAGWAAKAAWAVLNPRAFAPKDHWAARLFAGGEESHAGQRVSVDTALQLATVWACVRLIAETSATLPLGVYESTPRGREPAKSHPLWTLLRDAPNADMSAVEFWEALFACLLVWGNAYAEISRGFGGAVVALVPLRPDLVVPARARDGSVEYRYSDPAGFRVLPEADVLHLKGFSLDGLVGMSTVAQARQSLGLAMAADMAAAKLFANGMRSGGYVHTPDGKVLTDEQRDRAYALLERFKGAQNAGQIPILEAGWRFAGVTMPPQDAELLATRSFNVAEICRWYRVPPHMVGHTEKSTSWGTGLEQQLIGFLTMTLRPHLKRVEAAVKRRLLSPAERGRVEIEFNVEGLLRADSAGRAAFYAIMVGNGIYSRDECREMENKPRRGGMADALTVQSQNVPIDLTGAAAAIGQDGGPPLDDDDDPPAKPRRRAARGRVAALQEAT